MYMYVCVYVYLFIIRNIYGFILAAHKKVCGMMRLYTLSYICSTFRQLHNKKCSLLGTNIFHSIDFCLLSALVLYYVYRYSCHPALYHKAQWRKTDPEPSCHIVLVIVLTLFPILWQISLQGNKLCGA